MKPLEIGVMFWADAEPREKIRQIKAYGVKVAIPKGGESVGVSFLASRPGTFPFECSEYCGSGHKRMKGELVVEMAQ